MGEVDGRELEASANTWGGWRWKLCAMEVERLGVGNGGEGGVEVERFEEGWRSGEVEKWSGGRNGEDTGRGRRSEDAGTTVGGSWTRVRPGRELSLSCVWQHLTWAHVLALLLYPVWHRGAPERPMAALKCLYSLHTYDTFSSLQRFINYICF